MKGGNTCGICGKSLSDPVSIERGIGPECYGKYLTRQSKDKTGNLFANRAEYTWGIDKSIIWIQDLGGMKSVTNDLDAILVDIDEELGPAREGMLWMYCDSMGIWDGIRRSKSSFDFFPLTTKDYGLAKSKMQTIYQKGGEP